MSEAPDHLEGKKKKKKRTTGESFFVFCFFKKTNLVCFSSNTYISQLWLIHSSKSKSSCILHPFLTVQTGIPQFLFLPPPRDGDSGGRGCFPKEGSSLLKLVAGFRGAGGWALVGSVIWRRQPVMTEIPTVSSPQPG